MDLRFGKPNSSTQAGYRLTFSTEGNAVGKVVRWLGDVGRLIEVGTPIGITRRNYAKHRIIRFYYCEFQYDRILKTERYVNVQVVLLLTLINLYQGVNHEVILKYGDGDISESSWVSGRSKGDLARVADHYFHNPRHKTYYDLKTILNNRKEKCPSGLDERWLHSNEPFIAHKDPKSKCNYPKNL
jgi:hypothetical protein